MIKEILSDKYGLVADTIEKTSVGAGSDTYFISSGNNKYVLKFPADSQMNTPKLEPDLCDYLIKKGLPVCQFIRNRDGRFISSDDTGRIFHLQKYIEGKMYEWNTAPEWLLRQSAQMLGKIHTALKSYNGLPTGIGADFFRYMTPQNALNSYKNSLETAKRNNDTAVVHDLEYRIEQMMDFPAWEFDLKKLTCQSTHGDYFISQIICGENCINAVIDWTTACVHPVIWEIVRSFVYAAPCCADGQIDIDKFIDYAGEYLRYASLSKDDIKMMAKLFYYQISVCDYYGQYYGSNADNRDIYLAQAIHSTKLMKWFEKNIDELTYSLCEKYI